MTSFTRNRPLGLAMIALAMIIPHVACGNVLVSTLADPLRFDTPIGNNPNPKPAPVGLWNWAAQEFTTDINGYALTSIDAMVGTGNASPGVIAQLRADDVNTHEIDLTAGGLLGSFTPPDVLGTQSVRSFTPVGSVTLSPNTSYWFLLGSSTDGTYAWSYVEGSAYTGLGSIRQENSVADSQDSGLNWNYHALTSHPYFFQVNVNPVPVPAAVWFFGSALGLMGMKRRKATV